MSVYWTTGSPLRSFVPKLRREASERALSIATEIWSVAVQLTPVDSGELRASWNLSRRKPNYTTVGSATSASRRTVPLPPPTAPTLRPSALRSAKYFVTNGKSYAASVEFGSPTNAPKLMLTRAKQAAMS